jgi:hypothetical protein
MWLNKPWLAALAKIDWSVMHYGVWLPANALWVWINVLDTVWGVVSWTGRLIKDALQHPFAGKTYKDYKDAVVWSFKKFWERTKEWWEKYWAPTKWKRDKMYGPAKFVSGVTHAVSGWLKYGIWTVLDAGRRGLKTIPALFNKDRKKLIRNWFKDRQKKWRVDDYAKWFKDLKKTD